MTSAPASTTAGLTPEQLLARRDQNHDTEIYTCAVVFSALSIGSVAMRVTSRHMKNVAVGIDDVLVIISMVLLLAQSIFICMAVRDYGLGRHLWTLNEAQFVGFSKLWYTVGTLQFTSLFLTKISLLILFHRIFITPTFRLATKVLGVIMLLWWIGTLLADCLICIPIQGNWDPTVRAHCGNKHLLAIIPPIPWIVTDLVILLMPLPMVWSLHLPRLQRIGLGGLFLLGSLAMVASCVRYSTLFYQRDDVTYYTASATIWTIIESDVTIISVCLIVSRPWLLKMYPSKLISLIREKTSSIRRASSIKNSASDGNGNRHRTRFFSTFNRLTDTPYALNGASLGGPFDFDAENGVEMEGGKV